MKLIKIKKRPTSIAFLLLMAFATSCGKEDVVVEENDSVTESDLNTSACDNPTDFVFNENAGLVSVEFEDAEFSGDWTLKSDGNSFSGKGYMVWQGDQHLHEPGTGVATFKIKINNSGTYQFLWNSAVKTGSNSTDHNDTWLRFADADDFYAKSGNSIVYPKDSGKTPNPEGATKDGWFKVYRSGGDLDFIWNALTYDNNGHSVFVVFDAPGTYTMEVSARSSGHGVDKFVLFNDSMTAAEAIENTEPSTISCN